MVIKANVDHGKVAIPKGIMAQFEIETGDKVLVKPILYPS